jgi:hypothetical protein
MDTLYHVIRNAASAFQWGKRPTEPEPTDADDWVIVASFKDDSINTKEHEFVTVSEVAKLRETEAQAAVDAGNAAIAAIMAEANAKIAAIDSQIKFRRQVADACAAEAAKLEIELLALRETADAQ